MVGTYQIQYLTVQKLSDEFEYRGCISVGEVDKDPVVVRELARDKGGQGTTNELKSRAVDEDLGFIAVKSREATFHQKIVIVEPSQVVAKFDNGTGAGNEEVTRELPGAYGNDVGGFGNVDRT